jgi:hypothetical protein
METGKNSLFFSTFALLASSGTLVCCALPIILVSLGLGSVLVALNIELPFVFWKFAINLCMAVVFRPKSLSC